jgi:hypothetical protein
MDSVCVRNEKCSSLSLSECCFFVWQYARVRGTGTMVYVVSKKSSSRLEVGFGILMVVTMKITVFIFVVWQYARVHGTGTLFSLVGKKSSSRLRIWFWHSRGGDYEDYYLVECDAVLSSGSIPVL